MKKQKQLKSNCVKQEVFQIEEKSQRVKQKEAQLQKKSHLVNRFVEESYRVKNKE